jgi:hypothetical protein
MAPMQKQYLVALTAAEGARLRALLRAGTAGARRLRRAHTLLLADEGQTDDAIAAALHIGGCRSCQAEDSAT